MIQQTVKEILAVTTQWGLPLAEVVVHAREESHGS
jgi:hypothetical protein